MDINNYQLSFSSLGMFRKLFLIACWAIVAILSLGCAVWLFFPNIMGEELGFSIAYLLVMTAGAMSYVYWIHSAIAKRKTGQLLALIGIQIIPFLNPITALVFIAVYRLSKQEIELNQQYQLLQKTA
ncbi:hypothetical protein [Agarivorans sp. DSG3-1]|uniref:hypothetical protein n=1 Tax=Agarivorans sp. DSG3-1 TaxID=3342249 RepID=UPI00398F4D43